VTLAPNTRTTKYGPLPFDLSGSFRQCMAASKNCRHPDAYY
jgi:hypothetical protein